MCYIYIQWIIFYTILIFTTIYDIVDINEYKLYVGKNKLFFIFISLYSDDLFYDMSYDLWHLKKYLVFSYFVIFASISLQKKKKIKIKF